MSDIVVEEASFSPKITWVGGYASVLGINTGTEAALDSSLVWLIKTDDNELEYPVTVGELPDNAVDLTADYGGDAIDSLLEDNDYTFWVMKQQAWEKVSSYDGGKLYVDSTMAEGNVVRNQDSISVSNYVHTQFSKKLDVFVNVEGLSTFGQLGEIFVNETRSNRPIINWEKYGDNVVDSAISVIGICEGQQHNSETTVWEVYSVSTEDEDTVYGKANIIEPPVNVGETFSNTREFVEFNLEGLERDKSYYIWIADSTWNGEDRLRFAEGYAYATFNIR
jgi:hypothetical protein